MNIIDAIIMEMYLMIYELLFQLTNGLMFLTKGKVEFLLDIKIKLGVKIIQLSDLLDNDVENKKVIKLETKKQANKIMATIKKEEDIESNISSNSYRGIKVLQQI